jgi:hypothetical protein
MPSQWTHLAATYDGKNQALYVDGLLVASKAQTGPILASNGALHIGGNSIWGEFFQGQIDEVRIYNKALSLNEIQTDMATPIYKSNPPKLVIGKNQMESFVDVSVKGVAVAYRTTPQNDAAMTSISAYLDASSLASTELVAGIYSDNNGHPGTLLAQGKMTTAKAGETNKVYIPAVMLAAGKPYWIALLGPQSEIRFRDRKGTAAIPMEKSDAKLALATLPNTWPVGIAYPTDGPMSIYGSGY